MTPIEEIYTFLCDIYAERDFYSRCKLIDMFRDKIKEYDINYKNIPNSDTE